jgi:chemotaxis protein CheX
MISILIADDEKTLVDTVQEAFQQSFPGVTIITAYDGLDAYRKARNQSFHLICTDFRMPKLNGGELIRALREQVQNQDTPIFLISGFTTDDKKLASEFRDIYIFEKPFVMQNLIQKAKEILNPSSGHHKKRKINLDVNFINTFIEGTRSVLTTFGSLNGIKSQKPYLLQKGEKLGVEISGIIPLVSPHLKGSLVVGFPAETFLAVTSAMLGTEFKEITPQIEDAAAELANIIYSQTKAKLNERGYDMGMSRPSIVRGHNHTVSTPDGMVMMVVPFESSAGHFFIQVWISD